MASNPPEGYPDDFIERLLSMPSYPCDGGTTATSSLGNDERLGTAAAAATSSAVSQLSSGEGTVAFSRNGPRMGSMFPLDLSLASPDCNMQFRSEMVNGRGGGSSVNIEGQFVPLANLIPAFGHIQPHSAQPNEPQMHQVFQGQTTTGATGAVQNPSVRPKMRARRGQATDPHSIAERLRRERITERVKALQELVPSCSKTDRAAMLDEILDYVKFLRLQVKVLSMSRLGGAGAVAQLVADNPSLSVQGDSGEVGICEQPWDKWSTDGTEQEAARLMEKDVGAAMQFLQSKALCIMPVSLAAAIFTSQQQMDVSSQVKPEPNAP